MTGRRSYPPIEAPRIRTARAKPAEAIGDIRSPRCLPSVVSRQDVAAPSGVGTSQATHAAEATRVIRVPQSVPNENGSRFAIHSVIATVEAAATSGAVSFFDRSVTSTRWSPL